MAAEPTSPAQPPQLPTAGSLAGILDVLETDDDFRALIAGEIEEPESDIDPSITVGVPDGLRPALAAGAAVMVTSHLGRPKEGQLLPADSLQVVADRIGAR